MMENGFHPSITVRVINKKWNYVYEQYNLALAQNNTKWIYYDIFQNYLSPSENSKLYSNWNNEWILNLINLRTHYASLFSDSSSRNEEGWDVIERELRVMGLPEEFSVKKIDEIWINLIKTFKLRHKFFEFDTNHDKLWPYYENMKLYYISSCPEELEEIKKKRLKRKLILKDSNNSDEKFEDQEIGSEEEDYCQNINNDLVFYNEIGSTGADSEEFHWTPAWTESFIHIRLQNDNLFKKKKRAWKDLYTIMLQNNFPKSITLDQIRKKWNALFDEYRKSVAKHNTKWIYYDLIQKYLGDCNLHESSKNWSNDWLRQLIKLRIQSDELFVSNQTSEDECWSVIEKNLRCRGLPPEYSVRNVHLIWLSLIKQFNLHHKYIEEISQSKIWELYYDMKEYFLLCDPKSIDSRKKSNKTETDSIIINDIKPNLDEMKNNFSLEMCRVCLANHQPLKPLFNPQNNIATILMACTSIQLFESDKLPNHICDSCLEELMRAFKFKEKCEATDKLLKSSIKEEINELIPKICMDENVDDSPDFYENNDSDNEYLSNFVKREMKNEHKKIKKKLKNVKLGGKVTKRKNVGSKSKHSVTVPFVTESGNQVKRKKYLYLKVCDICGKETTRIQEHMNSHMDIKSFKCTKCPKTFTYRASLQTHLKTHDETPLKVCQLCGKQFFRNLTYKRHLVYHANERKFSCGECGKTFNTKDILQVHERSHTGIRPYSCQICGKSFYSTGCVSRHQKVHRRPQTK